VLLILAIISLVDSWAKNTPYAHLIPPISMIFTDPKTWASELYATYRLDIYYHGTVVNERRRQLMLDAQKRRLYRRAHGLEDLDADEVSGVDVKGLVYWDDGLTKGERERGGVYRNVLSGRQMEEMGARPGESFGDLIQRKRQEEVEMAQKAEADKLNKLERAAKAEEERLIRIGAKRPEDQPRRKVWFGIWG